MANFYPSLEDIDALVVKPTEGERFLLAQFAEQLDDSFDVYFNPFLDGDRPDFLILKKGCGAIIIEVKDWNITNYKVDEDNIWTVKHNLLKIRSPMQQAFKYKSQLFELHIPTLGKENILNRNFYKTIHCYVYFHKSTRKIIDDLYKETKNKVSKHFLSKEFEKYYLVKKRKARDSMMSFGNDNVLKLINKIRNIRKNILFNDVILDEFTRVLQPPQFFNNQKSYYTFDKYQLELLSSASRVKMKIRGVAGSGKTTLLAEKAAQSVKRHGSTVLILCYNLTLKNLMRDKIKKAFRHHELNFKNSSIEISNYHSFFFSQLNNLSIPNLLMEEDEDQHDFNKIKYNEFLSEIFKTDLFKDHDSQCIKYKTILIDEIQDFEVSWLEIIVKHFLAEDGEIILFGDHNQNIYGRIINKQEFPITRGFGYWKNLKNSHRANSPRLLELYNHFKNNFLAYYADQIDADPAQNRELSFGKLQYFKINDRDIFKAIHSLILSEVNSLGVSPNDIAILSSNINFLIKLEEKFDRQKFESTFESLEEVKEIEKRFESQRIKLLNAIKKNETELRLEQPSTLDAKKDNIRKLKVSLNDLPFRFQHTIKQLRRIKKLHFNANSGKIKIATVHSYKGFESELVFLIIQPNDSPEMVYAGMTRTSNHLCIIDFSDNSNYQNFFQKELP